MTNRNTSIDQCPACGSDNLSFFEERQVWICDECSSVVSDEGDVDSTTVEFEDSVPSNTDSKNSNEIDWQDRISISDKSDQNLIEVLSLTAETGSKLEMDTEQIVRAAEIVTEAWSENWMHGRTMEWGVAASIYIAGREAGSAIPPGEIAYATDLEPESVKSSYVKLKSEMDIDLNPPSPAGYVGFIVKTLNLPPEVATEANEILYNSENHAGNPIGIAGGAVYIADSEGNVTLQDIAEVTHLTKETIWKHSTRFTK